jgi:hypothetical protein
MFNNSILSLYMTRLNLWSTHIQFYQSDLLVTHDQTSIAVSKSIQPMDDQCIFKLTINISGRVDRKSLRFNNKDSCLGHVQSQITQVQWPYHMLMASYRVIFLIPVNWINNQNKFPNFKS